MNRLPRALVSVAVCVGVFGVTTATVTEGLASYVWPSLMLGIPVGGVAGIAAAALTFLGLAAWAERRQTGRVRKRTRRDLSTTAAVLGGFVVGGTLAFAAAMTQAIGLATTMLVVAMPAGLLTATIAGIVVARRHRRLTRTSAPPSPDIE